MLPERMIEAFKGALDGKVAIVTGAGRGIGRSVSVAFARAGASVCCVSRSKDEIEETVAEVKAAGGRAIAIPTDVSDMAAVDRMVAETVREFGGLDILMTNHGVSLTLGPVEDTDPELWRRTVEINLFGSYYCVRAAVPHLKTRGAGKIIMVGSGQGHRGTATTSAYSSSKGGCWQLMHSLAAELVAFNISVNELLPGNVNSRLYRDSIEKVKAATPAGAPTLGSQRSNEWFKDAEDVVPVALFMACQPDIGPTAQTYDLGRRP